MKAELAEKALNNAEPRVKNAECWKIVDYRSTISWKFIH